MEIQGNQLTITIPDGMIIDEENSTFKCIKFKPIKISKFSDYDGSYTNNGYIIDTDSRIVKYKRPNYQSKRNIFATEKQAKSALAMAQISQIMTNDERFGGVVTDEEWNGYCTNKYCLIRYKNRLSKDVLSHTYNFLAFHTEKQRDLFLKENEQLVKDYLMVE